ncbi:MAG: hypothetical protein JNK66_01720 [Chitinophagales bacterium]|nr:hypothetical protein [Chitinophagales bacterium]
MNDKLLMCFLLFSALALQAQTGKQDVEEMRKLQKQMQEENKMIQQQQEWNTQNSQQEIVKLKTESNTAKQEAAKAKSDAAKAKAELEVKKKELEETLSKIDSAKSRLAETEAALQTSEMIIKRTLEEKQRQEDSITILKKEQELAQVQAKADDLEKKNLRQKNNLYISVAAVALLLTSIIGMLFIQRQKTLRELAEKNKIIAEEKKRSDELLLNILPAEVMHELKASGKTQARNYAKATVLFADIKDFTTISEQLTPEELIEALDTYFERFDKVIEKYDIEKIKTIGDAYVCAGGVPTKSENNPDVVVKAALEFIDEINKLKAERTKSGLPTFEFRMGIHTGQLVAGVIGIRKFAYDIWGDTVNMAARMQQSGEPNKVNISGSTYALVKDKFSCVYRGKIEAKNKGEIEMYFVEKELA